MLSTRKWVAGGRVQRLQHLIFDVPLFHKILIANTILVGAGVVVGVAAAHRIQFTNPAVANIVVMVISISFSVLLNCIILAAALSPISGLRRAVVAVSRGNRDARVGRPFFGDPDLLQLGGMLNRLLDQTEQLLEKTQRQNRELEEQVARGQVLASQVLRAQEEERKRIALELHDEASQDLTAIILGHTIIEQLHDPEEVRARSLELKALAASTLERLHNLIVELRPSFLDDLGLGPALRWHLDQYGQRFGLATEMHVSGEPRRLPAEVETAIYRVVQEAVTNVARHAAASKVAVTIEYAEGQVAAFVQDDGCGFVPESMAMPFKNGRGLGLLGMQERASLAGGTCMIESTLGEGTLIAVHIPLQIVNAEL